MFVCVLIVANFIWDMSHFFKDVEYVCVYVLIVAYFIWDMSHFFKDVEYVCVC